MEPLAFGDVGEYLQKTHGVLAFGGCRMSLERQVIVVGAVERL